MHANGAFLSWCMLIFLEAFLWYFEEREKLMEFYERVSGGKGNKYSSGNR